MSLKIKKNVVSFLVKNMFVLAPKKSHLMLKLARKFCAEKFSGLNPSIIQTKP